MANILKQINFHIEDVNPLNTPPAKIKQINFHISTELYPDDKSVAEKQNNSSKSGFNNWDYLLEPPEDIQIRNYIPESGVNYDELLDVISDEPDITATNTGGIITDLQLNV